MKKQSNVYVGIALFVLLAAVSGHARAGGKALGKSCSQHGECSSGQCDLGNGSGNTGMCMPAVGTGKNGDICSHPNYCQTRICLGMSIKSNGVVNPGQCGPKQSNGKSCAQHTDCVSGQCDLGNGSGNTGMCMPAVGTGKNGDICSHPNYCQSRICLGMSVQSNGVVNPGQCGPKQSNGKSCSQHTDCVSGQCDLGNGSANTGLCMPAVGKGKSGDICSHPNYCQTGICAGMLIAVNGKVTPGSCGTKQDNGKTCIQHSDCKSGQCDRGNGSGNTSLCMPAVGTGNAGDICGHDNYCRSGKCDGMKISAGSTTPGTCRVQLENGKKCSQHYECASGQCDIGNGSGHTELCMPAVGTGATGAICAHPNYCRSGVCVGMSVKSNGVANPGQCGAKQSLGDSCIFHTDCASNRCDAPQGASGGRCTPQDGAGKKGEYCFHSHQCLSGQLVCENQKCSTPVPEGGTCALDDVCASSCCAGGKCAPRYECYKPEDFVCDLFTGGSCSLAMEIQKFIAEADVLQQKIETLVANVKTIGTNLTKDIEKAANDIASAGKKAVSDVVKQTKSNVTAGTKKVSQNVKSAHDVVSKFKNKGSNICGVGTLDTDSALKALQQAESELVKIEKDTLALSLKPITDGEKFVESQLSAEVDQQMKIATESVSSASRLLVSTTTDSAKFTATLIENILNGLPGSILNPVGNVTDQLNATIDLITKEVGVVDAEFTRQLNLMTDTLTSQINRQKEAVLFLESQSMSLVSASDQIMAQMNALSASCSVADANSLNTSVSTDLNSSGAMAAVFNPTAVKNPFVKKTVGATTSAAKILWGQDSAQNLLAMGQGLDTNMKVLKAESGKATPDEATRTSRDSDIAELCSQSPSSRTALKSKLGKQYSNMPWVAEQVSTRLESECNQRKSTTIQPASIRPTTKTPVPAATGLRQRR